MVVNNRRKPVGTRLHSGMLGKDAKTAFQRQISTEQLEGNKSPVSFLSG